MVSHPAPSLLLTTDDGGVMSEWTADPGELHFHNYVFDEYNTEVITLEAAYEHRTDIKALDWEETHRKWTGEAWQLDFAALDTPCSTSLIAATALRSLPRISASTGATTRRPSSKPIFPTSHRQMLRVTQMTMDRPILVCSKPVRRAGNQGRDAPIRVDPFEVALDRDGLG